MPDDREGGGSGGLVPKSATAVTDFRNRPAGEDRDVINPGAPRHTNVGKDSEVDRCVPSAYV